MDCVQNNINKYILFRKGKSNSPFFSFCQPSNESVVHFFWECAVAQDFIKQLSAYVENKFSITPSFTAQSWFFPSIADEQHLNALIITIAKLVIFRARHKEDIPGVLHFHSGLKNEAQKEEILAIRKNAREAFLRKWGNLSNIFSYIIVVMPFEPLSRGLLLPATARFCSGAPCRRRLHRQGVLELEELRHFGLLDAGLLGVLPAQYPDIDR